MNQCKRILSLIESGESITNAEAKDLGIMQLPARIWELRQAGYNIKSELIKGVNRYGDTVYYAKYTLNEV